VRKLSADSQAATPKLGQFPEVRKSVQNLVSAGLVSLEARGQSVDSSSMVSVYQQKIGTPTFIPFDDGTECFSYVGKSILLWNLKTREIQNSFVGHSQPVSKIKTVVVPESQYSPLKDRRMPGSPLVRANLLISASWDGTIKLWDIATAKCVATLEGNMGGITCINTYDNDTKLIAGSNQGLIKLWDLKTQQTIYDTYEQSPVTISAIGVWQDCSKFFAVSFDGCAYIWNLSSKRCEKILKKHKKRILDAQIYDSDTRLITASEDCTLGIWDLEKGTLLRTLEGHSSAVQVVAVYGDSQRAISGSTDGQLIAWDICTEDIAQFIVSSLDDHTAAIISIHVFEDGLNKMYTHSMDRKLRIWDMAANICEQTLDMPPTNDHESSQKEDTDTPLNILVAWNPVDNLSLQSIIQFIKLQGHSLTVCKSREEFLLEFMAPNARYHIVFIDLELPVLTGLDTQPIVAHFNVTGAKLVLLTTPDVHILIDLPDVVGALKTTSGFMELTEKPLTELTLAKILHEVAFSIQPGEDWIGSRSGFSMDASSSDQSSNMEVAIRPAAGLEPPAFTEGTRKSQIQNLHDRLSYVENLFACFVPVQFFEMISPKGRDRTQLGDAVCRSVTVLFSDIRDFSTMSESMAVSELMEFLNAYLAFAMPPIQENGGFVDKFIGDSIMALFSQDGTQQCISAVNCAISMMYHLDGLQDNGFTQVNTGIGINTGRMIIGLVGVETRMEPTVLGDAVNLASRLESLCKVYDSRVIISEYTRERMGRSVELYTMRELDLVAVKGKKLACKIYEILEAERKEPHKGKRMLLKDGLWDRALASFRKGDFQQALALFDQCQTVYPQDRATKLYIQRCTDAMARGVDVLSWEPTHRLAIK
jgi:class 3 adenylate cyclase